jgi:hypothetical protein
MQEASYLFDEVHHFGITGDGPTRLRTRRNSIRRRRDKFG